MRDVVGPGDVWAAGWTRRRWLGSLALVGVGALGAGDPTKGARCEPADDPAETIRRRAEEAHLKNLRSARTDHYLGLGDAPGGFLNDALGLCEKLAVSFQKYFDSKGFELRLPDRKMPVVVLADRHSYEAFKGEPAAEVEGGHYDVGADRLVVYDFRGGVGPAGVDPKRLNTFTLVHEAVHQLTFDTGLLPRQGDVPLAVSEGFATLGETWTLANTKNFGRENRHRLAALRQPGDGPSWIEVETLIARDGLFDDPKAEGLAYAESWLLVYEHLKTREKIAKLRAYLAALRDPTGRVEDARRTLGNLNRLDAALKRSARQMLS